MRYLTFYLVMTINIQISGQGAALVFFHGWGFDHHIWQPIAQELASRFQIYLVDLPGFGDSAYMEWPQFKQQLLQRLPPQFSVIGWSLGGLLAMRLATEEERVASLFITTSSPRFTKAPDWPAVSKQVLARFADNLLSAPEKTVEEFVALQLQGQASMAYRASLPGLQEGLRILSEWDLRAALAHYKKPACFVFGRLDAITPRALMRAMQSQYPHFHYHLFNKAAHIPFLSHPQEYLAVLQEFLS